MKKKGGGGFFVSAQLYGIYFIMYLCMYFGLLFFYYENYGKTVQWNLFFIFYFKDITGLYTGNIYVWYSCPPDTTFLRDLWKKEVPKLPWHSGYERQTYFNLSQSTNQPISTIFESPTFLCFTA